MLLREENDGHVCGGVVPGTRWDPAFPETLWEPKVPSALGEGLDAVGWFPVASVFLLDGVQLRSVLVTCFFQLRAARHHFLG